MIEVDLVDELPAVPAVYALCDGRWVAYVGSAGDTRRRIRQHLVLRNTSVTTGTAAVSLNPDLLTEVRWWEDERFFDESALQAAERIASVTLRPTLRSRSSTPQQAVSLSRDDGFSSHFIGRFNGEPSGRLRLYSKATLASRVRELERQIREISP